MGCGAGVVDGSVSHLQRDQPLTAATSQGVESTFCRFGIPGKARDSREAKALFFMCFTCTKDISLGPYRGRGTIPWLETHTKVPSWSQWALEPREPVRSSQEQFFSIFFLLRNSNLLIAPQYTYLLPKRFGFWKLWVLPAPTGGDEELRVFAFLNRTEDGFFPKIFSGGFRWTN